ncbi:MAG: HEAT repeat domain-containing protein [Gemmatimonadota bacterium]
MHHSLLYAKSLSLLLEEVQSSDDLTMVRSSLLRVRRFSRSHALALEWSDGRLTINGLKLTRQVSSLMRLTTALQAHGVARLSLGAGAVPRELLTLAMLLARAPAADSEAPTIFEELRDAALWYVQATPAVKGGIAMADASALAGDDVDRLIQQLLTSDSMAVRRACFDALTALHRSVDALVPLLQHAEWFVVRNAACLLGAMVAQQAEHALTATLSHTDERVRSAVVTALLQVDTPTSRAAVRGAIRDESPEVRRRAVRGFLAEQGTWGNVDHLLQALERERDLDVQLEFLYALGTLATPDAVQRLIRLCSIEDAHRPAEFRIAAAEALATARLGAAMPLLRAMLRDPDMHARAAARHLIRAVS